VGGDPNVWVAPLVARDGSAIVRVLVHTDGLQRLAEELHGAGNAALQSVIDRTGEAPTSDDVAVVEWWMTPPPHLLTDRLAAPGHVRTSLTGPDDLSGDAAVRFTVTWRPVSGASFYEVELLGPQGGRWSCTETTWTSDVLPPAKYRVRVRAQTGAGSTLWSPSLVCPSLKSVEIPPFGVSLPRTPPYGHEAPEMQQAMTGSPERPRDTAPIRGSVRTPRQIWREVRRLLGTTRAPAILLIALFGVATYSRFGSIRPFRELQRRIRGVATEALPVPSATPTVDDRPVPTSTQFRTAPGGPDFPRHGEPSR
jgi:hypothetical protein